MHSDHKEIESEFTPQNWALVVWGLMLSGFIFGITPLIAVIIAYVLRNRLTGTAYRSHMRRAILMFWIPTLLNLSILAFAGWEIWSLFANNPNFSFSLFTNIGVAFTALALINLWFMIVCVKGLVLAASAAPYRTWLGFI